MAGSQINFRIDPEDKKRIQAYLDATYKGDMSDFFRRIAFEKVSAWEALQKEERRKEEEHQARLESLRVAS